jgi:hypothetical protein
MRLPGHLSPRWPQGQAKHVSLLTIFVHLVISICNVHIQFNLFSSNQKLRRLPYLLRPRRPQLSPTQLVLQSLTNTNTRSYRYLTTRIPMDSREISSHCRRGRSLRRGRQSGHSASHIRHSRRRGGTDPRLLFAKWGFLRHAVVYNRVLGIV